MPNLKIAGDSIPADTSDFGDTVAWTDHKLSFLKDFCTNKRVLDLGCVQHNPANHRSRFWVHGALRQIASELVGLDIYEKGVLELNSIGFNILVGDAQNFDLQQKFDVIVVCDLIEHVANFEGLLRCCLNHMHRDSRLLISTPNPWYWRHTLGAALRGFVSVNPEHTCWLCPSTLKQLAARYDLVPIETRMGSRYLKDRLLPLPSGLKHTSFHTALRRHDSAETICETLRTS